MEEKSFIKACGFVGKAIDKLAAKGTIVVVSSVCPSLLQSHVNYALSSGVGKAGEAIGEMLSITYQSAELIYHGVKKAKRKGNKFSIEN